MLIEKAYCIELDKIVTAYEAREVFFSDENSSDKFYFYCANACCGIEIYGVNIYTCEETSHSPHFRKKPNSEHSYDCDWFCHNKLVKNNNEENNSYSHGIKDSPFPSELVSRRPGNSYKIIPVSINVDKDLGGLKERIKLAINRDENDIKQSPNKTIFLEHIVDCYEAACKNSSDRLETCNLTVNGKTKNYKSFFKRIKDFSDEEGLIYYGYIDIGRSREYGEGNYKIVFKDRVNCKSVSIYISKAMIAQYPRKKLFHMNTKKLMTLNKYDKALCYFVGAYPELKSLTDKKNPSKTFCVYDIALKSLDHLVIKFSDAGSR